MKDIINISILNYINNNLQNKDYYETISMFIDIINSNRDSLIDCLPALVESENWYTLKRTIDKIIVLQDDVFELDKIRRDYLEAQNG